MFACECYWYVYVCLYYSLAMLCCCCLLEACFWLKDVMIFSVDRRSRCHGILQKKKTCLIKHLDSFFLATCVCVRMCVHVLCFVFVSVLYFFCYDLEFFSKTCFFNLSTIILASVRPIFCICTTSELSFWIKSIQYFQQNKQTRFLVS